MEDKLVFVLRSGFCEVFKCLTNLLFCESWTNGSMKREKKSKHLIEAITHVFSNFSCYFGIIDLFLAPRGCFRVLKFGHKRHQEIRAFWLIWVFFGRKIEDEVGKAIRRFFHNSKDLNLAVLHEKSVKWRGNKKGFVSSVRSVSFEKKPFSFLSISFLIYCFLGIVTSTFCSRQGVKIFLRKCLLIAKVLPTKEN